MAPESESNPQQQGQMTIEEETEQSLKYLEFVQVAALNALVTFSNLYVYAKEKSGPLKPRVEDIEGTVKTVVGPVYRNYQSVPFRVLKFVDGKVDESVSGLGSQVSPLAKQAISAAQMAPVAAQAIVSEVQKAGVAETATGLAKNVYAKCEPKAKEIYSKYEPKMEQCAVFTWQKLNQLPLFPRVAQVAVPTAAYCAEKYNQTVVSTAQKGYRVSSYLPLVPSEKIAKVFGNQVDEAARLESN